MSLNLDHYKKRIEDELIKIQEGLNQTQQSAGTVILDQSSVGRLSRMDAMQQQAMAQGLRGRLQLRHRKLKGALVRIEAGNFGCCCQCDEPLDPARLEIDPSQLFCIDCLQEQ